MPAIFAIDGADFGDFGAASQSVLELQTALKALGQGVGTPSLKALVTDGLIGPKTTDATNYTFTHHIGPGQAPANFRTGTLSQATVAANASALAQLVEAEAQRRGYNVPTAKVISTVAAKGSSKAATASAPAPVAYTPTSTAVARTPQAYAPAPASDDSTVTIIKYGAIGLGLVIATAGIYFVMTRKKAPSRLRGYEMDGDESYKTFIRSMKSPTSISRPRTVDRGLTYDEAKRACARFNADRTTRQINSRTEMGFTRE